MEAAVVISIAFGYFIIGSIAAVLNPPASSPLSNAHLLKLLLMEPALAAVALVVLKIQGHLNSYGLAPTWKGAAEGLALGVAAYAVYALVYLAAYSFSPSAIQPLGKGLVASDLTLGLVIAISVVNPLFEEFFRFGLSHDDTEAMERSVVRNQYQHRGSIALPCLPRGIWRSGHHPDGICLRVLVQPNRTIVAARYRSCTL
jgi:hypothetical protein